MYQIYNNNNNNSNNNDNNNNNNKNNNNDKDNTYVINIAASSNIVFQQPTWNINTCQCISFDNTFINVLKLTKFLILYKRTFALLNFSAVLLKWCIQFKMPRYLRDWVFFYKV